MKNLKTETLIDAFKKALELNLSNDFINLLQDELNRRGIDTKNSISKCIWY
jgi:hypothetical protein